MMNFRIADTFTDSLAKLTSGEQKSVKTTAFDLQINPTNPGMSFHKLEQAKDKNFWSVRVNTDIRLIVHKTDSSLLLCYVFKVLDENLETTSGYVSISTMHLAKGLEFRAVVVMTCDDEIIPLQERIETVVDDSDLEEVYNTERHLLYVACTRARDHLLVTSVDPASEFLDDLRM